MHRYSLICLMVLSEEMSVENCTCLTMSSLSSIIHSVPVANGTKAMNMNSLTVRTVAKRRVRHCSDKEKSKTLFYFYKRSSVIFCMNAGYLPSNLRSLYDSRHVCMQLQLQARQRYHSSMIQHVCIHGETFVINQSERNTARKI